MQGDGKGASNLPQQQNYVESIGLSPNVVRQNANHINMLEGVSQNDSLVAHPLKCSS